MAKLPTITTITSANNNVSTLNSNFSALRSAFTEFLSRDGETPNTMTADLDLNSQDILNVQDGNFQRLLIAGVLVNSVGNLANWAGNWATTTAYAAYDIVYEADNNAIYRCIVAHTSDGSDFSVDLTAGNWELYIGNGLIDQAGVAITGGSINGTTIGNLTPRPGVFTNLTATGDLTLSGVDNLSTVRTDLGLEVGTDVQAQDDALQELADLTLAAGDVFYVNATPALVRLPAGSNGQVLTLAGGVPTWAAAGGGGGRTLINTYDLSVNTLDSGNEIDLDGSAYSAIEGYVMDGACATAASNIMIRVSDDGGSSFDAGATDYIQDVFNDTIISQNTTASHMRLTGNGTTAINGFFRVEGLNNINVKTTVRSMGSGNTSLFSSLYHRVAAQDDDFIRFFNLTGGAFTGGTMIVWGIT